MSAQPRFVNKLQNARCIVIGGTSGIGASIASALIEEGARVFVASSTQEKVDAAVKKLSDPAQQYNADARRIAGAAIDLSNGPKTRDNLKKMFEGLPQDWQGKVDHVIYTAADALALKGFQDFDYDSILAAGQLRLFSVIATAQVALDYWAQGGTMTITSGSVSKKPFEGWAVVNAFATGLEGLARGLALDLAKHNDLRIRVNCVAPGPVQTPLWRMSDEEKQAMFKSMEDASLLKRIPSPDIIAQTYLGILKDSNQTGQTIFTETGMTIV